MIHKSVLLQEVIEGLHFEQGDVFVDGTINGGGHSEAIGKILGSGIKMIGIDLDADALARAEKRMTAIGITPILVNESFRNIDKALEVAEIARVDKILLDLGLSSNQLEESGRGFSFQKDEPLTMTFRAKNTETDLTAEEIVNNWDEENIADIIYGYGEERYSRRIANAIVESRRTKPIKTTFELLDIIGGAVPGKYRNGRLHFATRTFQGLRIAVNDELGALREVLNKSIPILNHGGRIAVISFHSLEDRIVKNFFREKTKENLGKIITKKPIVPTEDEERDNPRSRSAKLRIFEKI